MKNIIETLENKECDKETKTLIERYYKIQELKFIINMADTLSLDDKKKLFDLNKEEIDIIKTIEKKVI